MYSGKSGKAKKGKKASVNFKQLQEPSTKNQDFIKDNIKEYE